MMWSVKSSWIQILGALLAFFLLTLRPIHAADIRGAAHDTHGRMVFEFDDPVRYTAELGGNKLKVVFSRPLTGDPKILLKPLKDYVSAINISEDRLTLTANLTRPVQLKSFTSEGAVVIDLLKDAPSSGGDKIIEVAVRGGDHDGFSRLVFDWPYQVGSKVSQTDATVTVVFDRQAKANLEQIKADPPIGIAAISAQTNFNNLTINITTSGAARIRQFSSGPKLVVDVIHSAQTLAKEAAKPQSAKPAPITDGGMPTDLLGANKTPASAAKPGGNGKEKDKSPPIPPAPVPAPSPPANEPVKEQSKQPTVVEPPPEEKTFAEIQTIVPPEKKKVENQPPPPSVILPLTNEDDDPLELAAYNSPGKTVSLSFSWTQPTAAATFRHAGYLWMVFDRYQEVDTRLMKRLGGDVIHSVEQLPSSKSTVVRITTEPGYNPKSRKEGLLWVFDLTRQPMAPANFTEVKVQHQSVSGARLLIPITEAGPVIPVVDSESGEQIFVVPNNNIGQGVAPSYEFPDVKILATAQGVAALRKSDKVEAKASRNGVEITKASGTGLVFSGEADRLSANPRLSPQQLTGSRLLEIENWIRGGEEKFNKVHNELLILAGSMPPDQRTNARMNVARHLFANGRGAEALGVLATIASQDKNVVDTPQFRVLRGAANVLMRRFSDAVPDLMHKSIDPDEETAFWQAAAYAGRSDPEYQIMMLREGGAFIKAYPKPVSLELGFIVIEAAIAAADDLTARSTMDALRNHKALSLIEKAHLNYLEAKYLEFKGNYDSAIPHYDAVMDGHSRLDRALAGRDKAELLYRLKRITRPQLIESLERLRFAWRGDNYEFNLLRRLVELYLEETDYPAAMRLMRQIVGGFREHKEIEGVISLMTETFHKLYLEGLADRLPPVTAIALFEEFRELTPAGEKGDEMIRKLADRLAAVELLDRAAELLQQQVQFRAKGMDKTKVGTKLAMVHLLNQQPARAISTLNATKPPAGQNMTPELAEQRLHTEVRALADLNKPDEAIKLIEGDSSRETQLLRAEIWWKQKNWTAVAAVFEELVPKPMRDQKLSDQELRFVLYWASALILAGDDRGIAKLRRNFLPFMQNGPYANPFNILTADAGDVSISNENVAAKVKEVENFRTFMNSFRERLRTERLSAIN